MISDKLEILKRKPGLQEGKWQVGQIIWESKTLLESVETDLLPLGRGLDQLSEQAKTEFSSLCPKTNGRRLR
jgi:hypothetical protein